MAKIINNIIKMDTSQATTALNGLSGSLGKTHSSFSIFGSALKTTGSQLSSIATHVSAFVGAIAGITLYKTIDNLQKFSSSFGLLQATVRMSLPESVSMVKKAMFEISNSTGEAAVLVTDSMTQLLSSGLQPTAAEGTEERKKQMMGVVEIQKKVSMAALGMGTSSNDMQEAMVKQIKATGGSVTSQEDWNEAFSIGAATLDRGIGLMKDYTNQFAKFGSTAKSAGWSKSESMAIFAEYTKMVSPDEAGHQTNVLAAMFTKAGGLLTGFKTQIKRFKNNKEDVISFTGGSDFSKLNKMSGKEFLSFFYDDKGMSRGAIDSLSQIQAKYRSFTTDIAKNQFLMNITNNSISRTSALMKILGGGNLADVKEMNDYIEESAKTGTIAWEKFAIMGGTFSTKRNMFSQRITNTLTQATDAMSPALGALMQIMSVPLGGEMIGKEDLAKAFTKAREEVKALYPMLVPVVDQMERLANFMTSEEGGKFFSNVGDGIVAIGKALGTVTNAIIAIVNSPIGGMFNEIMKTPWEAIGALFSYNMLAGGGLSSIGASIGGALMMQSTGIGSAIGLAASSKIALANLGPAIAMGFLAYEGVKTLLDWLRGQQDVRKDNARNIMQAAGKGDLSSMGNKNTENILGYSDFGSQAVKEAYKELNKGNTSSSSEMYDTMKRFLSMTTAEQIKMYGPKAVLKASNVLSQAETQKANELSRGAGMPIIGSMIDRRVADASMLSANASIANAYRGKNPETGLTAEQGKQVVKYLSQFVTVLNGKNFNPTVIAQVSASLGGFSMDSLSPSGSVGPNNSSVNAYASIPGIAVGAGSMAGIGRAF